jgi:hypothetical protein
MTTNDLWTAAHEILGAVQASYAGVPSAPTRYEVQLGTEATQEMDLFNDYCCQGAVIVLVGSSTVREGARLHGAQGPLDTEFMVSVLRCAPSMDDSGRIPPPSANDAALKLILADRQRVLNALRNLFRSVGSLSYNDPAGAGELMEDEYSDLVASTIEPTGGCSGTVVTFTIPVVESCLALP